MASASSERVYNPAEHALTSSILDHFESMQSDLRDEDKWTVSATMRYMLKWPAAPPIKTVILGQSPYPTAGEVPFIGAPFAYVGKEAPPSVVVLANTVSTCSAINDIPGLDWQACEDLFKNSDKLLQHGIILANARSSPRFQDEKAARECATLVACLVHLLRRHSSETEPIDIICLGVEAQRVCTLITKIWGVDASRRSLNVAKCSHPAHLARKERKMYRYCIRLDDPLATRMLTEALVKVLSERNDTEAMPVSQPQNSRYPKRPNPPAPTTPPQQSPPRASSESLGVGNWRPKVSAQNGQSVAIETPSATTIFRQSSSAPIVAPNSVPVASPSNNFPQRRSSGAGSYSGSKHSEHERNQVASMRGHGGISKSLSASIADEGNSRRPQRMMSLPLSGGEQADYNMAKALKDTSRRAAVVLDSAAKTELTQEAMIQASHALSELASIAKIMQDRISSTMEGVSPAPMHQKGRQKSNQNEKSGMGSPSEAGSAVSTLAYVSQPNPSPRPKSTPRGSRVIPPRTTIRRTVSASKSAPQASQNPSQNPKQDQISNLGHQINSAAHSKEVELIRKALNSSLGPNAEKVLKDPGMIDHESARYTNARNGTLRAAQRVSRNLTSKELEMVDSQENGSKAGKIAPSEIPLPDQESSVDDDDAANDDDFISVASERLNDADVNSAVLQTLHEDLEIEEEGNDPNAPLVGNGDEKSRLKTTMESVIWRLYNRQLGKDNQATTSQLSA